MADFAQLVLTADASGLAKGEAALKSLANTAGQTEARTTAATANLNRSLTSTGQAAAQVATQAANAAAPMRRFGFMAQTAAYQIGDFASQVSSGGNALRAFGIQLPQFLSAFGMWGSIIGAGVGVAVAMAPALLNMKSAAQESETAVDKLKSALELYTAASERAKGVTQEMRKEFGDYAAEVSRTSDVVARSALQDIQSSVAKIRQSEAMQAATASVEAFNEASVDFVKQSVEAANAKALGGPDMTLELLNLGSALDIARKNAQGAAEQLFILPDQVTALSAAFSSFTGATELKEMRDRGTELLTLFDQLYPAGKKIPDALRPAIPLIEDLRNRLAATVESAEGTADAVDETTSALGVATGGAYGLAGAIAQAAGAAANLRSMIEGISYSNLAIAAENAALMAGETAVAAANAGTMARETAKAAPLLGSQDGILRAVGRQQLENLDTNLRTNAALTEQRTALLKAASAAGGKGGSGGGVSDAMKEAEKATKEAAKAAEAYADALNAPFVSAIDGIGDAVGALLTEFDFSDFFGSLLNTFKSAVSQMVSFAIANPIKLGLGLGGVGGVAGAATTGGAGGVGSGLLGSLLGGGGAVGGIMSGLTGVLQQGGILGTLGQSFGSLGGLLGGSIGGLGAIGAAIPAIGAIALAASAIIGKKTVTGQGMQGSIGGGGADLASYQDIQTKRLFGLMKSNKTKTSGMDSSGLAAGAASILSNVGAYGAALGLNPNAGAGVRTSFKINTQGMSAEQTQAALTAELERYGAAVADATLGTRAYSREGESSLATLERLVVSMGGVNSIMDSLGHGFRAVGLHGAGAAASLADLFGGLEQFQAAASTYFDLFYSDGEKFAATARQATSALALLGASMPKTRDEYRKMVEAQDLNTEGGRRLYATLVSLAGAMDELLPASESAVEALSRVADEMASAATSGAQSLARQIDDLARGFGDVAKTWVGVSTGIIDFLRELVSGERSLNGLRERTAYSLNDYKDALRGTLAGSEEAAKRLTGSAGTYLDNARASSGSALEYMRAVALVRNELAGASDVALNRASLAQLTFNSLDAMSQYLRGDNVQADVVAGFATQVDGLIANFNSNAAQSAGAFAGFTAAVVGSNIGIFTALAGVSTAVDVYGQSVVGSIGSYGQGVVASVDGLGNAVIVSSNALGAQVLTTVTGFSGAVVGSIANYGSGVATSVNALGGTITGSVTGLTSGVVGSVLSLTSGLGGAFTGFSDRIAGALGGVSGGLVGAVSGLTGAVNSQTSGLVAALSGISQAILQQAGLMQAAAQARTAAEQAAAAEAARIAAEQAAAAERARQQAAAAEAARQAVVAAPAVNQAAALIAGLERQAAIEKTKFTDRVKMNIAEMNARPSGNNDRRALDQYLANDAQVANTLAALRAQIHGLGGVPSFALGGLHGGGLAMVGENGPELVDMGPARVYNNRDSSRLLNLDPLVAEVRGLREENRQLQTQMIILTQRMARTQSDWDRNGQPPERAA